MAFLFYRLLPYAMNIGKVLVFTLEGVARVIRHDKDVLAPQLLLSEVPVL